MESITKDGRERAGNSLYPGLTDYEGVGSMERYYSSTLTAHHFQVGT